MRAVDSQSAAGADPRAACLRYDTDSTARNVYAHGAEATAGNGRAAITTGIWLSLDKRAADAAARGKQQE